MSKRCIRWKSPAKVSTKFSQNSSSHWIGREIEGAQYKPADAGFFRDVLQGVLTDQVAIDRQIDRALSGGWPLSRLELVMRAALRAGVYELRSRKDVPARVVIKEYVDVAGAFFGPYRVRHGERRARPDRA